MWCRAISLTGVILVICSLSGCLIIPTNFYKDYSRKNVGEEAPSGIVIGVTTREMVLLTLGEPDNSYEDESEFRYIATKLKLIWCVGAFPGAGCMMEGTSVKEYVHVFHFDRNGLVEKLQLSH